MSLTKPVLLDALRAHGAAFRAAITADNLDATVTTCPGWTLADLVSHLGGTYRRVRDIVARATLSIPENPPPPAPAGVAALEWFDIGLLELLDVLEQTPPESPAWNWSIQPDVAGFWHRRMAHETIVHRWDAQTSVSLPAPIPPTLAADGVAEVIEAHLPTEWDARAVTATGVVQLLASDTADSWVLRVRSAGVSLLDVGGWFDEKPQIDAAATGTASDLMLMLWGRIPPSVLDTHGDVRLIEALRTGLSARSL